MASKLVTVQLDGEHYQVTEKKYGGAVLVERLHMGGSDPIWDRSIHGPIPSEIAQRAIDKAGSKVKYTKHQLANPEALVQAVVAAPATKLVDAKPSTVQADVRHIPAGHSDTFTFTFDPTATAKQPREIDVEPKVIKDVPFMDTPPGGAVAFPSDMGRRANHLRSRVAHRDDKPFKVKGSRLRPGDRMQSGKIVKSILPLNAQETPGIMTTLKCTEMAAVQFEGEELPVLMTDHSWFYITRGVRK